MGRIVLNFQSVVVLSDESTFQLNGEVNRHNCRYWSDEHPYWLRENLTQYLQKVNVLAGIFKERIVGPFLTDRNVDEPRYLALLQEKIFPPIQEITGDDFNEVWCQLNGEPVLYRTIVRNYLDVVVNNRWTVRRGNIEWPA